MQPLLHNVSTAMSVDLRLFITRDDPLDHMKRLLLNNTLTRTLFFSSPQADVASQWSKYFLLYIIGRSSAMVKRRLQPRYIYTQDGVHCSSFLLTGSITELNGSKGYAHYTRAIL